jgi:thiamine biosynthesis lipoprotein
MANQGSEAAFVRSDSASIPNVHRFSHLAMATTFEIIIQYDDPIYARQAADAAFYELDRLEGELSRFIENSDISRLNNLPTGQPLLIGLDTYHCLELSKQVYSDTNGAFDITIGSLFDCWLNDDKTLRTPSKAELDFACKHTGADHLQLAQTPYAVELFLSPLKVDLGGIGKGYAVDRMADLLRQWGIDRALIHGGYSSLLALDGPLGAAGWPVTLSEPTGRGRVITRLFLHSKALSASGLRKGMHIINPRTANLVKHIIAAWSLASNAAIADALSTAFMVMSPKEIEQYCQVHPDVSAMVILARARPRIGKILRFGFL